MTLSVAVHGLALAAWFCVHQAMQGATSVGHKRGSLSVTLVTPPSPATQARALPPSHDRPNQPAVMKSLPAETPRAQPDVRRVLAQPPAEAEVPALSSSPPMPAKAVASNDSLATRSADDAHEAALPAPPSSSASQLALAPTQAVPVNPVAEQPGARFASLFAPIISRPLGRGRWGGAPQPQMVPVAQAAMQREQAIQGIRQTLAMRIERIKVQLRDAPLTGACDIGISLDRQTAQVSCQQTQDLAWVSAQLSDLMGLVPASVTMPGDTCLTVAVSDVAWVPCRQPPMAP